MLNFLYLQHAIMAHSSGLGKLLSPAIPQIFSWLGKISAPWKGFQVLCITVPCFVILIMQDQPKCENYFFEKNF